MKKERSQIEEHMRILAEKHSRELEIQQLQNLQTFRAYREVNSFIQRINLLIHDLTKEAKKYPHVVIPGAKNLEQLEFFFFCSLALCSFGVFFSLFTYRFSRALDPRFLVLVFTS